HPRFVLLGQVRARADSLQIDAALYDTLGGQPVARAVVSGHTDSLARLAADLAWQLMAIRPTRRSQLWNRASDALTPSIVALRAFLAGNHDYVNGRFVDAARKFKAAVDADTAFALAYFYLGSAANWAGDYDTE